MITFEHFPCSLFSYCFEWIGGVTSRYTTKSWQTFKNLILQLYCMYFHALTFFHSLKVHPNLRTHQLICKYKKVTLEHLCCHNELLISQIILSCVSYVKEYILVSAFLCVASMWVTLQPHVDITVKGLSKPFPHPRSCAVIAYSIPFKMIKYFFDHISPPM